MLNLPHGVIVDNLGLNGLLITPNESERQIFLTAAKWVGETDRVIHAIARVAENATSAPVMFHIRKPGVASRCGQSERQSRRESRAASRVRH